MNNLNPEIRDPSQIEEQSMRIIEDSLQGFSFPAGSKSVYQRIVHTTGDPSIVHLVRMSAGFVEGAIGALQKGCSVFTDVEMIRAGISRPHLASCGGQVYCDIHADAVVEQAKQQGQTRASTAVYYQGERLEGSIYAIGNAPTALFALLNSIRENQVTPSAIIGVPVGFVGAAESKEALLKMEAELQAKGIVWITIPGTRGGSTIAVAIVNALLRMACHSRRG